MKNPYDVIIKRYITEKAGTLEKLQNNESNPCVARCKAPKVIFIVNRDANKQDVALAVEAIYKEKNVKVTKVNTIHVKPKPKRRGRGRPGSTVAFKKAIVTLEAGDVIDNV